MATGSRALTLKLLADIDDFTKNLDKGEKSVSSVGDKIGDFGKKAAVAFAAAGAAAAAFAAQSIKNAVDDEASQRKLELTIEATTKATAEQIKGVAAYIDKTQLAIGVTDDQLRPAFARLTRSTNDVLESQKLLNLALDISAATGAPLETIANALGKAYDGNVNALGKLGLGLDASILKSKDFDKVFLALTGTFGGFAANEADSTEKSFARIKIAIDEAQERIGTALLPVVKDLSAFILTDLVPRLDSFIGALTGDKQLTDSMTAAEKSAFAFGVQAKSVIKTVISLKDEIIAATAVIAVIFVTTKIAAGVAATITLIKGLITVYNALKASALVAGIAQAFALNPLLGVGAVALAAGVLSAANVLLKDNGMDATSTNVPNPNTSSNTVNAPSLPSGFTAGAPVIPSTGRITAPVVGGLQSSTAAASRPIQSQIEIAAGVAAFRAGEREDNVQSAASIAAGAAAFRAGERGDTIIINNNVNGLITDPEQTARAMATVMNDSFARGTGGSGRFQVAVT